MKDTTSRAIIPKLQVDLAQVTMPLNKHLTILNWQKWRWLMALIGLLLLVAGQILIASSKLPSTLPIQFGKWLNDKLFISIPTIDNILNGLPILLLGGSLLAFSLHGPRLLPAGVELEEKKPFGFRLAFLGWPVFLCAIALFGTTLWSLATRDYTTWLVVGCLISLLIFSATIAIWDQRRGTNLSPCLARQDILWLLGLVIIGLVIGTYRLQSIPDSLIGDDGSFWTAARDIATGAFKPPIFAVGVFTFPILSSYFQAWVLKAFGITFWGWRFSSVLFGVATIIPLYLLAREAFNRKVAIASSFALITSPYLLAFSRLGYISIQALFITTLALYWIYIGLNRDSYLYLFLAGCASGLGFYTFFSARIAILVCMAFISLMWLCKKLKFRQAAFALGLLVLGTLMTAGPYLVYGMSHDASGMSFKIFESLFFNTFNGEQFFSDKELFAIAPPMQVNGNTLFYNPRVYLILILRGLVRTLLAFQKPGLITEHYIASSLTGTIGAFFYLIGLGISLWKIKQPRSMLLLIWFFGVVLGLSTLNTVPPRHTHMVSIIPALALFIGIGLCAIANTASTVFWKLTKYKNHFLSILITGLCMGGLIDFFIVMPDKYHPQPDQVMSWAVLYAQDESFYYIFTRPEEKDFQPYVVTEFRQSVPFQSIPADTFAQTVLSLNTDKKTIIFYTPSLAQEVEPVLQAQWVDRYIQKTFFSPDGIPVLVAGMNTPFVFVRDQSFLAVLKDSYLRPTFLSLLAILSGLLAFTAFIPVTWLHPVPVWLRRFSDWFNGPEQPDDVEDEQVIYLTDAEKDTDEHSSEPPEWADQLFQPALPLKSERIKLEFKWLNTGAGKDYFIKIHLPKIKILGISIPDRSEFALPGIHVPNSLLLILAILLAIVAQAMVYRRYYLAGIVMYILSSVGLIVWFRLNSKWKNVFGNQWHLSPRAEKLLLGILLSLAAFFRYFDLSYRTNGLDIDEIQWTIQSWYSTILMFDKGDLVSRFISMPVSFWIRSAFLRLFGVNFISPRIESATLDIISIIFLYLLVRKLTASKPLAILSSLLYSFSFIALNLSHQALGQTTSEVWILASLYFLVLSLHERRLWRFLCTGILLALGSLTNELFIPIPIIALGYLVGLGLFEIIKNKSSARQWFQHLFVVFFPVVLFYFIYAQGIINILHGYDQSLLTQVSKNGTTLNSFFLLFSRNITQLIQTIFSQIVWPDSLANWAGPLINPILLPFVVIGFIYNFWNIRRPYFVLVPIWFLGCLLFGPIAIGAADPKVLYTILAPIMIWGAIGLWTFLAALRTWFDDRKSKLAVPVFSLLLSAIIFIDYLIFISSLTNTIDQQKRLELAELTVQSAEEVPMILYPYSSIQDASIPLDSHVITLSIAGEEGVGQVAENHFKQIEFSQVLAALWEEHQLTGLDLFFEKANSLLNQQNKSLDVILRCYPGATLGKSGQFFSVYHFDEDALRQPMCYQGASPAAVFPQEGAGITAGSPITFTWDTQGVESKSHLLLLEQKTTGTYWIEVEDAFSGPHWDVTSAFVNDFSGNGFLLDEWQAGNALYNFTVPVTKNFRIWIRSYKRRINDQHNFIAIGGNKVEFAGSGNMLDTWVWDDLGTYNLSKGQLPLILSRTYGNDEEYSVFIDSLLITSDLVNPPDQVKVWENVVNTGEIVSTSSKFTYPEILMPGEYRWNVHIFDGDLLVDSKGLRGLESPLTGFTINH